MNTSLEYFSIFPRNWISIITLEIFTAISHCLPYTLSILVLLIFLWLYILHVSQQQITRFSVLIHCEDIYHLNECLINLHWLWILMCLHLFVPSYFMLSICFAYSVLFSPFKKSFLNVLFYFYFIHPLSILEIILSTSIFQCLPYIFMWTLS